jgi:hypothetical protein
MPSQSASQTLAGYCNNCGSALHSGSRFCSSCGSTVDCGTATLEKGSRSRRRGGLVLVLYALGVGVVISIILAVVLPSGTSQSEARDSSVPSTQTSAAVSTPSENPPDPAEQRAAKSKPTVPASSAANEREKEKDAATLKEVREEWIKNTQEELWRQGVEMTFQARGTTLYLEYVLAGQAFAFQFGETFLGKNGATLKALGFKKVYLSNGEDGWTWNLARY